MWLYLRFTLVFSLLGTKSQNGAESRPNYCCEIQPCCYDYPEPCCRYPRPQPPLPGIMDDPIDMIDDSFDPGFLPPWHCVHPTTIGPIIIQPPCCPAPEPKATLAPVQKAPVPPTTTTSPPVVHPPLAPLQPIQVLPQFQPIPVGQSTHENVYPQMIEQPFEQPTYYGGTFPSFGQLTAETPFPVDSHVTVYAPEPPQRKEQTGDSLMDTMVKIMKENTTILDKFIDESVDKQNTSVIQDVLRQLVQAQTPHVTQAYPQQPEMIQTVQGPEYGPLVFRQKRVMRPVQYMRAPVRSYIQRPRRWVKRGPVYGVPSRRVVRVLRRKRSARPRRVSYLVPRH